MVTQEMIDAAMREFEQYSTVLRYREAEKWHTVDKIGMMKAIEAALAARPTLRPRRRLATSSEIIFGGIRLEPGTYEVQLVEQDQRDEQF